MAGAFSRAAFSSTAYWTDGAPVARRRFAWLEAAKDAPVVAEALMDNLRDEYGEKRGRHIYFAMEREQKGPFAPGNKYDAAERPTQPLIIVQSNRPPIDYAPKPDARD